MAEFTTYTTKGQERWDNIAHAAYGDASKMVEIMAANKDVALYDILPDGITLYIPVLAQATIDENLLPPWKR
jgi:nucleoid-associated protein YgaU